MKNRIRKTVNFLAFNLLFFALYLNFIHKDQQVITGTEASAKQASAFGVTVAAKNAEKFLEPGSSNTAASSTTE